MRWRPTPERKTDLRKNGDVAEPCGIERLLCLGGQKDRGSMSDAGGSTAMPEGGKAEKRPIQRASSAGPREDWCAITKRAGAQAMAQGAQGGKAVVRQTRADGPDACGCAVESRAGVVSVRREPCARGQWPSVGVRCPLAELDRAGHRTPGWPVAKARRSDARSAGTRISPSGVRPPRGSRHARMGRPAEFRRHSA